MLRQWLIRKLGGTVVECSHKWTVLIENYPRFTSDYWQCSKCGLTKVFPNEAPPEAIKEAICSLGHIHIINGRKVTSANAYLIGSEQKRRRAVQVCSDKLH